MVLALPDLIAIAVLITVYGLITAGANLTKLLNWFISNTIGRIPLVNQLVKVTVGAGLQATSNFLGDLAGTIEGYIGKCFHLLAAQLEWVGREIAAAAEVSLAEAERLAVHGEKIVQREITDTVHTATDTIVQHTVTVDHTIDKVADAGLQATVGALEGRVGILEGDLSGTLDATVEGLRARTKELEAGYQRAWDLLKQHEEALGIGAVTTATALALSELGGSWIRCDGVGALGKALCGLGPALIEGLLAGVLDIAALFELCEIVTLFIDAASSSEVQDVFRTIVGGIDDLIKCRNLKPAKPLSQRYYVQPGALTAYGTPGVPV
jgi:hypothetical protein